MNIQVVKKPLAVSFLFVLFLSLNSCHEKGCTDRNAINFSIVADEDDGSCIVCKSNQEETGSAMDNLMDFNFSGPHYQQDVARITVRRIKDHYNNSACGNGNDCRWYFKIQNLVSDTILDLPYSFQFSSNSIFFSFTGNASILPFATTTEEAVPSTVSNPCGSMVNTFLNFNTNGTIIYR